MTSRRWAAGLLLISAALLAYELLLMRLLALAYWGHFAGLVISIAMLGVASAGLFLFFARERVLSNPEKYFAGSAGLFGLAAPAAFLLSQRLPFTPFLLTWSAHEYAILAARSVLFFVPFFAAGVAIGVPFAARVFPMGHLYFWNMLGSGLPALPLLLAMNFVHPMHLLSAVAFCAFGSVICCRPNRFAIASCSIAAAGVGVFVTLTPFRYSEYKELPKTLLLPEAKVVEERYGWDGVVQIVESPHTRYFPGLSLNFAGSLPPAHLVFTDAGAMMLAFREDQALAEPDFLRMTPEAFSFVLTRSPHLLQFYGSTADLFRARLFGAREARLVDDSATRAEGLRSLTSSDLRQAIVVGDARQTLSNAEAGADVIAVSLVGTHGTSSAGAASLDPSFLLTTEGLSRLYGRLAPGGHAAFSTWIENPPKSGVRLVALWIATLREQEIDNPSRHLLALRSWSTLSFFIGTEPFDAAAIEGLKKFCIENSFDLVWFDGIDPAETNQTNVIPEDPYYAAFAALLGPNRDEFLAHSPFAVDPPTDDRPFFNQSFRWGALPKWISSMGLTWLPFVEWGYVLHVATLLVVTLLGFFLLVVPCVATRARPSLRTALLFLSLGVAYMFVQIWAISKLALFVAHPLLASALVLAVMLSSSGAGAALLTQRVWFRTGTPSLMVCAAIGAALAAFPLLMSLFGAPTWLRMIAAAVWLAVPAFFMGFPFPTALARLDRPADIPWALALNGFGSVLGALLATLLALHFGLRALGFSAVVLYAIVAFTTQAARTDTAS